MFLTWCHIKHSWLSLLGVTYIVFRFATDLALWEPASPAAVSKANAKSMLYSCMDLLQPAATSEDRFLMCKSALKEGERARTYEYLRAVT